MFTCWTARTTPGSRSSRRSRRRPSCASTPSSAHSSGSPASTRPRGRVVRIALDHESLAAGPASWETLVPARDDVIAALGVTSDGLFMVTSHAALDTVWHLDPHRSDTTCVSRASARRSRSPRSSPTAVRPTRSCSWTRTGHRPRRGGSLATTTVRPSLGRRPHDPRRAHRQGSVTSTSYRSLDGTEVGLFLVHGADVTPSPETPSILDGYGSGRSRSHRCSSPTPQRGARPAGSGPSPACTAVGSTVRSGAFAGNRANKQNVFDDFQAAADHLVAEGLTSRERLAVHGGWNGGCSSGRPQAAAGPVPAGVVPCAAARHDPLPTVPHRPPVDGGTATPTSPTSSPG